MREFGKDHVKVRVRRAGGGSDSIRFVELLGWGWRKRLAEFDGRFEVLGALEWDAWAGGPVVRIEDARQVANDPETAATSK